MIYICSYYIFLFIFYRFKDGAFDFKLFFYFLIFLFFCSVSIIFKNDIFIKWKSTIIYWIICLIFFYFYIFNIFFLSNQLLKINIKLDTYVNKYLNIIFSSFFFFLGFLNLYIIYNYNTQKWIFCKLILFPFITFVFLFFQVLIFLKYIKFEDD